MSDIQKKKILFVITKSNFGGAQRYVFELATGLPPDRFDVVVAFGGNGLLKERLEKAGIRTYTIKSFERDINLQKEVASMFELARIISEERPDVIHLNSSKAGGTGALIARLYRVPRIIFTAHGWPFYEARSYLWKMIVWFLSYLTALLAHKVIVVSQHDREKTYMLGVRKKIVCIHTAIPPIPFETRDDAREALFSHDTITLHAQDTWIVTTGEHTGNKNLGMLINAIKELRARGHTRVFLTLIGDGELRNALEELRAQLGVIESVHFTGFIPEARVFLRAFDIFVMPSRKEGFPYSLLEAGAAGLAVVASRVGGIPEIIDDKRTGRLIDPHDPEMLTRALEDLVTHPHEQTRLGDNLKATTEKAYTLSAMLTKTISVYENGSLTA